MNDANSAHPMGLAAPLALFFAAFFAIPLLLLLWVSLQGAPARAWSNTVDFSPMDWAHGCC
jgi:hypothetical protein